MKQFIRLLSKPHFGPNARFFEGLQIPCESPMAIRICQFVGDRILQKIITFGHKSGFRKKSIICQFFALLLTASSFSEDELLDLNQWVDDFVLETKKIEIPGYPDAFNPSLIRWKGHLLMSFRTGDFKDASDSPENDPLVMSFRIRDPSTAATNQVGLIVLDDQLNPISRPQILDIPSSNPCFASRHQDPRLVQAGRHVYLVFSNIIEGIDVEEIRRMFISELTFQGGRFVATEAEVLSEFEGESEGRWQKNWAPFDYEGKLLLTYSIEPHRILYPVLGTGKCQEAAKTTGGIECRYGILRGGTPALLDGNEYIAIFHTCHKNIATVQSNGKKMDHYFMGAYTFCCYPPFKITRISKKPILHKDFYSGPPHKTWKPLRVVFPCGIVIDDHYVWVAYGRQDHEAWVAKLDKKALLRSLTPVE